MNRCKDCDYYVNNYVNNYGYGQCYGQKNAPRVDDNECCGDFKKKSTTYREQFVGETDKQYEEYKAGHDSLFNNLEEKLKKAEVKFTVNDLKDAIVDEFKYRASQGRTQYSMEEVIYIVNEVIDEVTDEADFRNKHFPSVRTVKEQQDIEMELRILKGDMKYLADKISKLESLINTEVTK